jgi:hypothetical protein
MGTCCSTRMLNLLSILQRLNSLGDRLDVAVDHK